MQISEQILSMKDDCVKIRRDLHRIPEIGFELHKTHEYIKPIIEACRPDELKVLAEVGLKAVFYAKGADRTIAFRADMDGMKNTEENKFRFRSRNKGVMHGCGHDMHTAMMLGAAKLLKEHEEEIEGTVKLEFQPAEEIFQGSPDMILSLIHI